MRYVADEYYRSAIIGFCKMTGREIPVDLAVMSREEVIALYYTILIECGCLVADEMYAALHPATDKQ